MIIKRGQKHCTERRVSFFSKERPLHYTRHCVFPFHCLFAVFVFFIDVSLSAAAPHLQFEAPRNFVTGPIPSQIFVLDLDGDGDSDLAVRCSDVQSGPFLQLLESSGNGDFFYNTSIPLTNDVQLTPLDLNGDGRLDLVQVYSVGLETGGLTTYIQTGPFTFSNASQPLPFVPDKVVGGNLNGLGGIDLAICNAYIPEVRVYFGDGGGGFVYHSSFERENFDDVQTNFSTIDAQCGDFDGNGLDDMVITNSMSRGSNNVHNVVALFNQGGGNLGPFQVLLDPFGGELAIGNMDGDQDLDVVTTGVASTGPDLMELFVIKNNGNGTFQAPLRYSTSTGLQQIGGVVLADIEADGDNDVGIILYGLTSGNPNDDPTDRWALLRNDGLGNLLPPEVYPAGADILDLVLEDVDGTGSPDALTAAGDDDRINVTYNQQGSFLTPAVMSVDDPRATIGGTTISDIVSGDFNGNGLTDLALIANHSRLLGNAPDTMTLINGGAGGVFSSPVIIDFPQQVPLKLLGTNIADGGPEDTGVIFLGDDLYGDPKGLAIYLGTTGGVPMPAHFQPLNGAPADLAALDVNSDLLQDLVVLRIRDEGLTAGISVITVAGDGVGSYLGDLVLGSDDVMDFDTRLPYVLTAADMDGDNKKDVIAVSWNQLGTKEGIISVIRNFGDLSFSLVGEYLTVPREATDILAADVTGDGLADVILTTVASMDSPQKDGSLEILPNLGGGALAAAVSYNVGTGPVRVIAAQMDAAAGLDLIVANDGSNEITVLYNDGNGIFPNQERYLSGGGTDGLTGTDFDQDGDMDLAVTNDEHISFPGARDHYGTVTLLSNRNTVVLAGDLDVDGDVDGNDLRLFAKKVANGTNTIPLQTFLNNFGRTTGGN